MTATAQTNPVNELLEELTTQAQAVTLATYQDFLHTVASLVIDGVIDPIQRESIIKALVGNGHELGGRRLITNALTAAEKQLRRDNPETAQSGADWSAIKRNDAGIPLSNTHNARAGCLAMGYDFGYDTFTRKTYRLSDKALIDDLLIADILKDLSKQHAIEIDEKTLNRAVSQMASCNTFDSLVDHVDALPKWDGVERLDEWLHTYLGCDDNVYVREAGRIHLMAMIARAYLPGIKYDNVLVLGGSQGKGKSLAAAIIASTSLFSDENLLEHVDDTKKIMEATAGKWVAELAEMGGLNKKAVESVKGMISRTVDESRMAFGRHPISVPRRFIMFGTVNPDQYLRDDTGNRRFMPVKVCLTRTDIDNRGLARDRDQLLAEAKGVFNECRADLERAQAGGILDVYPLQISSPEAVTIWKAAQDAAYEVETGWLDVLSAFYAESVMLKANGKDSAGRDIVTYYAVSRETVAARLELKPKDITNLIVKKIDGVMKTLGWEWTTNPIHIDGRRQRVYKRSDAPELIKPNNRYE